MPSIFQYTGQAIAYTLFAVVVGYFATQPAYTYFPPDKAQIKLSFGHAGKHETECRRLTQEELNKLAPNMRRPMDCPRRRLPTALCDLNPYRIRFREPYDRIKVNHIGLPLRIGNIGQRLRD